MALTSAPTNAQITHRDGVRAAKDIFCATLGVSSTSEFDGAATFNTTLLVTGIATFTGNPVFTGYPSVGGVSLFKPVRVFRGNGTPTSDATAGNKTYTIAELLTGTIVRDCTGGSRTDVLPTAANAVAGLAAAFGIAPAVGDSIDCLIINGSDPVSEIITLTAGSGGAFDTNQTAVSRTILGTDRSIVRIRFTNVTSSSEAYVCYM